jgi:hypothetical protein
MKNVMKRVYLKANNVIILGAKIVLKLRKEGGTLEINNILSI